MASPWSEERVESEEGERDDSEAAEKKTEMGLAWDV